MNNIWRIFRDDWRYARSNAFAVLAVLVLCFAPAAFAWLSVAANWNPYADTANLKVAVVNGDDGYESDLVPVEMNIGDRVVDALRDDGDYGWTFVGEDAALEGVRSGEYFAAIIIPNDFSSKMMAALASTSEQAEVKLYLNEKVNPVAAVGSDDAGAAGEIRSKFADAVDKMSVGLASDLVSYASGSHADAFGSRLISRLGDVADDFDTAATRVRMLSELAGASSALTTVTAETLSQSGDATDASQNFISKSTETLDAAVESARSAASDIERQVKAAKSESKLDGVGTEAASRLVENVGSLVSSVESMATSADSVNRVLQDAVKDLVDSNGSVASDLDGVRDELGKDANKLGASASKIRKFQDDVASAVAEGDYSLAAGVVGGNSGGMSRWLADPVQVEEQLVSPVENYGSSVAPFYAVLAIWAGSILLVLVMRTDVSEARARRYEEELGRPLRSSERYFGRYLVFAAFALVTATLVAVGYLFVLRVQCVHPLLFLVACWMCALAFSNIVYTLTALFGGVGTALSVLMLVAQVGLVGGGYPLQMTADFFQVVQSLMPFAQAMGAMQAAAAGLGAADYVVPLLLTAAFLVLSLALAHVVSRLPSRA